MNKETSFCLEHKGKLSKIGMLNPLIIRKLGFGNIGGCTNATSKSYFYCNICYTIYYMDGNGLSGLNSYLKTMRSRINFILKYFQYKNNHV